MGKKRQCENKKKKRMLKDLFGEIVYSNKNQISIRYTIYQLYGGFIYGGDIHKTNV